MYRWAKTWAYIQWFNASEEHLPQRFQTNIWIKKLIKVILKYAHERWKQIGGVKNQWNEMILKGNPAQTHQEIMHQQVDASPQI